MARYFTPEQCGRRILKVCADNYIWPGEQLLPQTLDIALVVTGELRPEDVTAGLQWLVEQEYLAQYTPSQSGYVLTPKGYAAYRDC